MPRTLARQRAVEERQIELLEAILEELRARPIAPSVVASAATADPATVTPPPTTPTPRATAPASRLLTTHEVADRLACDARTVRRWARLGQLLRPIKVGNRLRWRAAEFDEWLERRRPA
ncbi:MAG: helix-turn-helix domain-containing protein [Planctomycetes bacterium]|nr:helix-turn-helix domain-containing protein [Planctomycetota bacterium]